MFDIVRRDVVTAKLDALGVPAEVSRLVLTIYHNQRCRQATAYGLSPGRIRGATGLAQGLPGSTLWSLLAQDPLWVLIADEMLGSGRSASAYGVTAPPRGWSDDYTLALANEAALGPTLAVFGAACQDLGVSTTTSAIRRSAAETQSLEPLHGLRRGLHGHHII